MITPRWRTVWLIIILISHSLYSAWFIAQSSFVINGERYFVLFDDAMISMRYARNLAAGYGPIWNPNGAHVEGITNPLWMLYMALVHLLPVPASKISLLIQISGALFMLLNLFVVKQIAEVVGRGSAFVTLSAVGLTAFYFPMTLWGLLGMEVSMLLPLVSTAVLWVLRCLQTNRFSPAPYLLLGIGTLARLDILVVLLVVWLFLIATDPKHRGNHIWVGILTVTIFIGGQTLLRWWYYGDVLPNTYYLKMTGFPLLLRLARGLYVSQSFISGLGWPFVLATLLILIRRHERSVWLLAGLLAGQLAYSTYVGGDAWETWGGCNRFVSIVMPLFFVLFAANLAAAWRRMPLVALLTVLVAAYTFSSNVVSIPNWLRVEKIPHMIPHKQLVQMGLWLRESTTPDAHIAVVTAGTIPYFAQRDTMIDLLGKNDPVIAHMPGRLMRGGGTFIAFYPGHNKWDYAYSIGQLQPDVVAQVWAVPEEAKPYLDPSYRAVDVQLNISYRAVDIQKFTFYYLNRSTSVIWEKIDHINHE
jgi:hypothetical protein